MRDERHPANFFVVRYIILYVSFGPIRQAGNVLGTINTGSCDETAYRCGNSSGIRLCFVSTQDDSRLMA
jgi:hypothetical protein